MKNEVTVDVNARLVVSDETAERCLRILEMWQNDNPLKGFCKERTKDGKIVFHMVDYTKEKITEPYKLYINACDPVNKKFIGYRCNECNTNITLFLDRHCPNCGRRINWEAIKNENSKI